MASIVEYVLRRQLPRTGPQLPGPLPPGPLPPGPVPELRDRTQRLTLGYPPIEISHGRLGRLGRTGRAGRAGLILLALGATVLAAVRIDRLLLDHRLRAAVRPIEVAAVRPVGSTAQIVLPGTTAAWHQSAVHARVDGSVAQWLVDIGDKVEKGALLCLLETPQADAELAAARAALGASQAQVRIRRADFDFARTTYERWRDSPKGVVSDQERAAKRAAYESAAAQLSAAEAQVAIDRVRVDHDAALAALKRVTAPLAGVITARNVDIGTLVTAAGAGSSTVLYQLVQDDPIRVFVRAPQRVAADLMRLGVPAEVRVRGPDGVRLYQGRITRTGAAFDHRDGTLVVEVDLPNPHRELVPGMAASVAFSVPPRGALAVPASAVVRRAGESQIAEIDPAGRIRFHEVTVARDDGEVIELSAGAHPGDLVALHTGAELADGDPVKASRLPD